MGSLVLVAILLAAILFGGLPFVTVSKGYVGVKTRFGKVIGSHLNPGLQWKTPFIEAVWQVNVQQDNVSEHSDAASKDLQKIDTDVKLLYSLEGSMVPKAYDRIGDREAMESKIITPAIKEVFKSVNANYTAEELITQRAKVSQQIEEDLNTFISKSCNREGLDGLIRLDNVAIEDFQFSPQFDQSIEEKQIAEQQALRAIEEKNRTITQAEAQKEKVRLESEANALQITNEANARAEAISLEGKALSENPKVLQLRQIEAWDGTLPKFMSSDNAAGFLLEIPTEN